MKSVHSLHKDTAGFVKSVRRLHITSETEMLAAGRTFGEQLTTFPAVIELVGDVGSGKTTFTRGLAEGLGITAPVTSPSFTISKSYAFLRNGHECTLTHYDFYRLDDPGLMVDDLKEKLRGENLVVIEWASSVKNVLPKNRTTIHITYNDDGTREVIYNCSDASSNPILVNENSPSPLIANQKTTPQNGVRLYLDTSAPTTILKLNDATYEWHSDRALAEKLLQFIHDKLKEQQKDWHDLTEITFMAGPGSFTGLRIGAAVVNTLAHELNIPLCDHHGTKHQIIIPDYGHDANIGTPRK